MANQFLVSCLWARQILKVPWRHGFNTSALHEDSTAMFTCTAVFLGLEKEWRKILPTLGTSIGKVLAFQSQTTKEILEGGVPSVKLLCMKGDKLPQWIQITKIRWKCFSKNSESCILWFTKSMLQVEGNRSSYQSLSISFGMYRG